MNKNLDDYLMSNRRTKWRLDFAHKLQRRRTELGLSQAHLAAMAGIHHTYITHMEKGRRLPRSVQVIGAIFKALDFTHSDFVDYMRGVNEEWSDTLSHIKTYRESEDPASAKEAYRQSMLCERTTLGQKYLDDLAAPFNFRRD